MADPNLRLEENAAGEFFVDETCIDCDTCRQIAPEVFRDHGGQSSVFRQPATKQNVKLANMAVVACPTGSIGAGELLDSRTAVDSFPFKITENIYYCGFNSEDSFGAWSYLLIRPADKGGNILIDSPRFSTPLVKNIEKLGGIQKIFLTHKDDIADHQKFTERFNAPRFMHSADGARDHGVENIIEGEDVFKIDAELKIIPVPGHTRGSQVLLYKNKFLFSGDHLAWSPARDSLTAFRSVCWFSWTEQTRSMKRLLDHNFEWVLPGHGRIAHRTKKEMRKHLKDCIEWMRSLDIDH
jgi:glyoxylase-like metal-dependent hydrolase (beta-lactamase superfamily II)